MKVGDKVRLSLKGKRFLCEGATAPWGSSDGEKAACANELHKYRDKVGEVIQISFAHVILSTSNASIIYVRWQPGDKDVHLYYEWKLRVVEE